MPMREYVTLKKLKNGEVVDLGGIFVEKDEGQLKPGDLYIGERNTGPKLLTVRYIDENHGIVHSTDYSYPFDDYECVKVKEHVKEDPCEKCESTGYTDDCMSRGCY